MKSHLIWGVVYLNPGLLNLVYLVGREQTHPRLASNTSYSIMWVNSSVWQQGTHLPILFQIEIRFDYEKTCKTFFFFQEILISIHSICKNNIHSKVKNRAMVSTAQFPKCKGLVPDHQNVARHQSLLSASISDVLKGPGHSSES